MTQEQLTFLSLVVASAGFIIATISLYFSHLMPPKIKTTVGPYIKLYHSDYNLGFSTGIYLPISFFNHSARTAVVEKAAIEIYSKQNDQKRYFLQWDSFSEYNPETNKWKWREMAHALPVLGKSSIQKTAWFYWSARNEETLIFNEGVYAFDFLYWLNGKKEPIREHHELILDSKMAALLCEYRDNSRNTTVELSIDKELDLNKVMSPHESEKLLGK